MPDLGEFSGASTFAMGVVALVLVAVTGSAFLNRRFEESRSYREIERSLMQGADEIEELEQHRIRLLQRLETMEATRQRSTQQIHRAGVELKQTEQHVAIFSLRRSKLGDQIHSLQNDFAAYRQQYRKFAWFHAEGELLGDFTTADGRVLRRAIISKVTASGLDIRHEDGFAKIPISALGATLKDRFQWEERPDAME